MAGPEQTRMPGSQSTRKPEVKARLAADPQSPFFARVAAGYLQEGRTREALALCQEGTKIFTRYATGSLILGKCYEALGQNAEALAEYRRVLEVIPDSVLVQDLAGRVEKLDQLAYEEFTQIVEKGLEGRKGTMTFEEFSTGAPPPPTSTVEFLIKQLQQAPKIARPNVMPVTPITHEEPPEPTPEPPAPPVPESTIVTETLAEIYASQGQFQEAIQAYTTLSAEKPEDAPRFAERIAQLRELLKLEGSQGESA